MGTYQQFQEALETQLIRLTQFTELKGSNIEQLIDKLRQNRFNLVILGAFKRGKSQCCPADILHVCEGRDISGHRLS
jgi:hypothetical protein